MKLSRRLSGILSPIRKIILGLFMSHMIYLILLRWIDPPVTITQLASLMEGHGISRDMVDVKEISSHALLAVIAAEDQLFPKHHGFDLKSIEDAIEKHQKGTGRIRGASTISQQTAKNVFLWQGRSWIRKGMETYCTFLIELIWGKERILEVYLNVAEMGPGIFGIEAAARKYYNKSALRLSRQEASRIAACLPNPKKYRVAPPSGYVLARSNWILTQMHNLQTDPEVIRLIAHDRKPD